MSSILIGAAVHHMLIPNGADYVKYKSILEKDIKPVLTQLVNNYRNTSFHQRKIIWFNQFPTIEYWGTDEIMNTNIHSEKIHKYNLIVQEVLKYTTITTTVFYYSKVH